MVGVCLVLVIAIAAAYLLAGAGMGMTAMQMSVPMQHMGAVTYLPWTAERTLTMFLMWWVMMIAMMLPSAAPTILLAAALNRRSQARTPPYGKTATFTLGYLLAWALFSMIAVALQHWLEQSGRLSMHLESVSDAVTGTLLLIAGLWQFSPLKQACLRHCRSPADFLVAHRRPGSAGALVMGMHHGSYCLGCCWFLMGLLFVGGVMNIYWIVGLASFVFMEKVVVAGNWFSRLAGIGLSIAGILKLTDLIW